MIVRAHAAVGLALALILLAATPARAEIASLSGSVVDGSRLPPFSLDLGQTENDGFFVALDELQGVTPGQTLNVLLDSNDPTTAGYILGDQLVDSHILHFDPVTMTGVTVEGWVTFVDPVVGLITDTDTLIATDASLGLSIDYGTDPNRRLDTGIDEVYVTSDPRVLYVSLTADTALDHVRVLTSTQPGGGGDGGTMRPDGGAMTADGGADAGDVSGTWDGAVPGMDGSTRDAGGAPASRNGFRFTGGGGASCAIGAPGRGAPAWLALLGLALWRRRRRVRRPRKS